MTTNTERAQLSEEITMVFAETNGIDDQPAIVIVGNMLSSLLHWVAMCTDEGLDGRKEAMKALRHGLSHFIAESNSETDPNAIGENIFILITARTENGIWVSETGQDETITETIRYSRDAVAKT